MFNEVGLGLRRNLLMTLATVVTVSVSMVLLGIGGLVWIQVGDARDYFYAQVEVSIWLEDGISQSQLTSLNQALVDSPVVDATGVIYESQDEAYEKALQLWEGDPAMQEMIAPEDLPASFRVKLTDPEQFDVIYSQFTGYPGVEEVADQRDILGRFFSVMRFVLGATVIIAGLALLAAAVLIFNTIQMTAFARRQQTGIMKLVGATNWYIRLPFILEGIVAAVLGALVAGAVLVALVAQLRRAVRDMAFIPFIGVEEAITIIPVLVLGGVLLASISSFLALRRFLAV
ncbi:MAG TPA: permease-like cell division protein FtsX [Egibacteraceae bacterium]|nr:permease-like cell division protein FtsX [Egibacteraceae bacterium]